MSAPTITRTGHAVFDTHPENAGAGTDSLDGHGPTDAHVLPAVEGTTLGQGHRTCAAQTTAALAGQDSPAANDASTPMARLPRGPILLDPTLLMAAQLVDDLEGSRIANENRLRTLTRLDPDEDGVIRGFGLDLSHPDVARLAAVTDGLAALEHQAVLNMQRAMRAHPLGPWIASQRGAGAKTAARLLAAVGDPYWNTLHDRPRTVSELWAYCGLHVLPAGQRHADTHPHPAGGDHTPAGGDAQARFDAHDEHGVAARRQKGQRANWSSDAKSRAYLIAEAMLKAGNRATYDARRTATAERVHAAACVRCGPSGKPAPAGSPWSKAHQHADALRVTSKAFLRDLWVEARRLHMEGTP